MLAIAFLTSLTLSPRPALKGQVLACDRTVPRVLV